MATIDLSKLGLYLSKQKDKIIYLELKEIENIIGKKLPPQATTPRWWYNVAQMKRAQTWLSNGYRTINSSYITARNGVEFERIPITFRSRIKYSRIFNVLLLYFIMPLFVAVSASIIVSFIDSSAKLNEKISVIEECFLSNEYDGIEEKIYEVIPQLEKNNEYKELCNQYRILVEVKLKNSFSTNQVINDENLKYIIEKCQVGIVYADMENSLLCKLQFYNLLGTLFQYQYKKTMDIKDAYSALNYLENSRNLFMDFEFNGMVDINKSKTYEDILVEYEGIETNNCRFAVYYSMILNGEYSNKDLEINSDDEIINSIFFKLYQCSLSNLLIQIVLEHDLKGIENVINFNPDLMLESLSMYGKIKSLFYLLNQKYETSIFFRDEMFNFKSVEETLLNFVDISNNFQNYYIQAATYFELARIYYYSYIFERNEESLKHFDENLSLFLEIMGRENLTLIEFDKYFTTITCGELLDYYIEELEAFLSTYSFLDNPSLYSYAKWDLGKHYYYKAVEIINQNVYNEHLSETIFSAEKCCNSALIFFTEESNPKIFYEINNLKKEINVLQLLITES